MNFFCFIGKKTTSGRTHKSSSLEWFKRKTKYLCTVCKVVGIGITNQNTFALPTVHSFTKDSQALVQTTVATATYPGFRSTVSTTESLQPGDSLKPTVLKKKSHRQMLTVGGLDIVKYIRYGICGSIPLLSFQHS